MPSARKISVDVRNFGPIRSGKFDLRPLTVFTGKNNTGKSWLASIVYALFSYSSSTKYRAFVRQRHHDFRSTGMTKFVENPSRWIDNLEKRSCIELSDDEISTVSSFLDLDRQAKFIAEEIFRCSRAIGQRNTIRINSKSDTTILVRNPETNSERGLATEYTLNVNNSVAELKASIHKSFLVDQREKQYLIRILRYLQKSETEDERRRSLTFPLEDILELIHEKTMLTKNNALYLPAERVGLINNYRTFVSSALQENIDHNSLQSSGVNLDFIRKLLDILQNGDVPDCSSKVSYLERDLLMGNIEVSHDSFNIPQFFFHSSLVKEKLPLNIASAMVSQIAPVVLFLRYYHRTHKMFIVEEPEAHLHPENQVKFIQEICRWVRKGYKVLLTTHSEWIIEELSNQVLVNELDSSKGLNSKSVGTWEVRGSKDGSTVREIKWRPGEAGYDDGFDRVADKLSNRWHEYHGTLE